MFSGEGLQRYQTALEQIKGIYDSMDDNSEGKERLKNIIDQSELDDFENNLDNLTEDKIINIQFEYDLATVQQQIDEIKNSMVGSGGTTEQYMSLIASNISSMLSGVGKPITTSPTKKATTNLIYDPKYKPNGKAEVGDIVTYKSGNYFKNSNGTGSSGSKHKGDTVYITKIKKGAKKPYHISTGKKYGSGNLGWVNLSQLKGYAKGTMNVPHDQLAWTQENNKPEAIIRKSDGAVLTPLGAGDMVVSQKQMETLRTLLTTSPTHIAGNLGAESLKTAMQNISNIKNNNVANNEIHLTMNLPNVTNYDEFMERVPHDLMHNKNFVGAIQAATVGEMSGGSSLRKYRI